MNCVYAFIGAAQGPHPDLNVKDLLLNFNHVSGYSRLDDQLVYRKKVQGIDCVIYLGVDSCFVNTVLWCAYIYNRFIYEVVDEGNQKALRAKKVLIAALKENMNPEDDEEFKNHFLIKQINPTMKKFVEGWIVAYEKCEAEEKKHSTQEGKSSDTELQQEIAKLKEENKQLKEELKEYKTKDSENEARIVDRLTTVFFGNEEEKKDRAKNYLAKIRDFSSNQEIVRYTAQLVRQRMISDMSCKRPLWKVLFEERIYSCQEGTWNKQINHYLTSKE